jgi:hypothetical protein
MAFNDLDDSQKRLILRLFEIAESRQLKPEFLIKDIPSNQFERGKLSYELLDENGELQYQDYFYDEDSYYALNARGYIGLRQSGDHLLGSLTPKFYEQYKYLTEIPAETTPKEEVIHYLIGGLQSIKALADERQYKLAEQKFARWHERSTKLIANLISKDEAEKFSKIHFPKDSFASELARRHYFSDSVSARLGECQAFLAALLDEIINHPEEVLHKEEPIMSNLLEDVTRVARFLYDHKILGSDKISVNELRKNIGLSREDFDAVDVYLLSSKYCEGTMGGDEGYRWLTLSGVRFAAGRESTIRPSAAKPKQGADITGVLRTTATPSTIFISYRRSESSVHAGRLSDQLAEYFGPQITFIDIESIDPGRDFVEAIEDAVSSCKILLAVIGRQWLTCANEHGRRLDDPNDFVRLEIAAALRRGIRVIPIFVQGATMPREQDLPTELVPLTRKQAWLVRESGWKEDVRKLIEKIEDDITPKSEIRRVKQEVTATTHSILAGESPVENEHPEEKEIADPALERAAEVARKLDYQQRLSSLRTSDEGPKLAAAEMEALFTYVKEKVALINDKYPSLQVQFGQNDKNEGTVSNLNYVVIMSWQQHYDNTLSDSSLQIVERKRSWPYPKESDELNRLAFDFFINSELRLGWKERPNGRFLTTPKLGWECIDRLLHLISRTKD